jgi:hypothetical protein
MSSNRFAEALAKFIRWVMRDLRYHRHYPATVELLRSDGSMDVTPDDDEILGLGLPPLHAQAGLPGTVVHGARGARCLVGFRAGDPRQPYISAWSSGGLALISVDGGTAGIAGMGDPVEVLLPEVVTVEGLLEGFTQPPGAPPPPPIPTPPGGLPFTGVATVPPGTVTAQLQGGRPNFLV